MRRSEVEAWRKIEGPDSKNALDVLVQLGFGLEKLGRDDEAEHVFDEAIEGGNRVLGPSHYGTLMVLIFKASMRRTSNDLDESERILNQVLHTRAKYPPIDDDIRCLALVSLSAYYKARGQPDHAIDLLREAVDACEGWQGNEVMKGPEDILPDLARDFAAALCWDEAERALDKALLILRSRQETRATREMIQECESLLREFKEKKNESDGGQGVKVGLTQTTFFILSCSFGFFLGWKITPHVCSYLSFLYKCYNHP